MNGVHINWTKPSFVRGAKAYEAEAHELLTTVLSALNWKKLYGPVYLYADRAGLEYYERVGYLPLWDGVKELAVPESVSAVSYWARASCMRLRTWTRRSRCWTPT